MKTIIFYVLVMAIIGIRSYMQNKAKQEKMRNDGPNSVPQGETEVDMEEEDTTAETESYDDPLEDLKKHLREKYEAQMKAQSLAEEAMQKKLFEEGSARKQHSRQFEAEARQPLTEHEMHPNYDEPVKDEKGFEMTPEKMREALIYQTIIERPQY